MDTVRATAASEIATGRLTVPAESTINDSIAATNTASTSGVDAHMYTAPKARAPHAIAPTRSTIRTFNTRPRVTARILMAAPQWRARASARRFLHRRADLPGSCGEPHSRALPQAVPRLPARCARAPQVQRRGTQARSPEVGEAHRPIALQPRGARAPQRRR